jgi:hypothetical protein
MISSNVCWLVSLCLSQKNFSRDYSDAYYFYIREMICFDLLCLMLLSAIFQLYHMVTSFSGGGRRSTRREPLTMGKQLVNFAAVS